jgi:hypothetical protein
MTNETPSSSKQVVQEGFSPKPATLSTTVMAASPSIEPDTPSPNALLDAPIIGSVALEQPQSGTTVSDGIVRFKT